VIGPETGILNLAGISEIRSIVLLSHSSEYNLCKDWKNNIALSPPECDCYPCHILHYDTSFCKTIEINYEDNEEGEQTMKVPKCIVHIDADMIEQAIKLQLRI
jgi:hypothetical protein